MKEGVVLVVGGAVVMVVVGRLGGLGRQVGLPLLGDRKSHV